MINTLKEVLDNGFTVSRNGISMFRRNDLNVYTIARNGYNEYNTCTAEPAIAIFAEMEVDEIKKLQDKVALYEGHSKLI